MDHPPTLQSSIQFSPGQSTSQQPLNGFATTSQQSKKKDAASLATSFILYCIDAMTHRPWCVCLTVSVAYKAYATPSHLLCQLCDITITELQSMQCHHKRCASLNTLGTITLKHPLLSQPESIEHLSKYLIIHLLLLLVHTI